MKPGVGVRGLALSQERIYSQGNIQTEIKTKQVEPAIL